MRHARLFLGWVVDARGVLLEHDVLLDEIMLGEEMLLLNGNNYDGADISTGKKMNEGEETVFSPLAVSSSSGNMLSLLTASSSSSSSATTKNAILVRKEVWQRVRSRLNNGNNNQQLLSNTINNDDHDVERQKVKQKQHISLYDIFPDPQTESAAPVLQYILWMRSHRQISANYEANILRGLIKLVKFRFASELSSSLSSSRSNDNNIGSGRRSIGSTSTSTSPTTNSKNTTPLDDLPIVVELRKIHREAGNKGKKAPRSSDEGRKWLEWTEYLGE